MVQVGPRPATPDAPTQVQAPPLAPERTTPAVEAAPSGPRWRRYSVEIPIDPQYLPFLALMLVGLALRFWDLGAKAFHHDESLHAFYSWRLYDGEGYVHDPMMHGPLLFELNALAYLLFGANDFTARLVPALFGVAIIGMPYLLRRELGRAGAIAASALFVISPAFLYFSRFLRHDIYVDAFTLLMIIGVFRYLATEQRAWFYTACVAAALLFATKEDFYISGFIPFTFLVGSWFLLRGESRRVLRARVRALGWQPWAIGLGLFLGINLLLYTTFFTNLQGVCSAVVSLPVSGCTGVQGALNYWLDQQDFARGGQPWFYYFMLLPLYEFVPLLLAVLAVALLRPKELFFWFCVYWFIAALLIYSWAGEKMPWMLPQITLPLILLAGRFLGDLLSEFGFGPRLIERRSLATGGLLLLATFALLAWLGLGAAQVASPLVQQSVLLQRLALAVLIAGVAGSLVYLYSRWGAGVMVPGVTVGLLAVFGAAYLRTSLMVTYDHPDVPDEPLIYVQTTPDVPWITSEIDRIAAQTGKGKDLNILLDNGWGDGDHEAVSWPFEWYLRDYHNRRYYTKTIDPSINLADYPVLLARSTNLDPIQAQLSQYTCQTYKLNAWFPEDYKMFAAAGPGINIGTHRLEVPWLRFDLIAQTLSVPDNRVRLLKFLLYRQPPDETGAREMEFCVHKEIPALGPAPVGATSVTGGTQAGAAAVLQPAASQARDTVLQTSADGSAVFGRTADGRAVLNDPKDVAMAPDGRLYVVEGRGARVTAFNPDGSMAATWGSPGTGDGQFQEPWGIAVAPNGNVYVADTWNHRIQYFDPNGTFLGKWGSLGDAKGSAATNPSLFWGPRSIAISPAGEVFVTDTGNKRIQVFGLDGTFKRMFGGAGSAPGQFNEEVGLALDSQGNVWVADTWNNRIQELSPTGQPLAQLPVPGGWESQNVTNKPYVAVDGQGRVVASFPDQNRLIVFGPDGSQQAELPLPGNGSPVGVAIAPDGHILVADARGNVVDELPMP